MTPFFFKFSLYFLNSNLNLNYLISQFRQAIEWAFSLTLSGTLASSGAGDVDTSVTQSCTLIINPPCRCIDGISEMGRNLRGGKQLHSAVPSNHVPVIRRRFRVEFRDSRPNPTDVKTMTDRRRAMPLIRVAVHISPPEFHRCFVSMIHRASRGGIKLFQRRFAVVYFRRGLRLI